MSVRRQMADVQVLWPDRPLLAVSRRLAYDPRTKGKPFVARTPGHHQVMRLRTRTSQKIDPIAI